MKKLTFICIITLTFLLVACEQPTPTLSPIPTTSPISVPLATSLLKTLETQTITSTVKLFWDDPLVASETLSVGLTGYTDLGATSILSYTCEPRDTIACANYPFTRSIPTIEVNDNLTFTFLCVLDSEARINGMIVDEDTRPLPFVSSEEPGYGQENGDIPWSWEPEIPDDYLGSVELWQRIRGLDIDNNLPEITVPYYVNDDGLQPHDARGFFLIDTYTTKSTYITYMPFIMKGD